MPRFSANLSMLFTELPFLDRFEAAAMAGFRAVECQSPYDSDASLIAERLNANGLQMVLHNLPAGNWAAGERGLAIFPDRVEEFRAGLARAIAYAKAFGCTQLNCLAGIQPRGLDEKVLTHTFIENLRYAADALSREGIHLLIEAINTRDMPGFYLSATSQGLDVIAATGSNNLFLQYDVYHMHIMEGLAEPTLSQNLAAIKHIQIADHPGRHEPGTGTIDFPALFKHIDQLGYDGWIGCEYHPQTTTVAGLSWLRANASPRT